MIFSLSATRSYQGFWAMSSANQSYGERFATRAIDSITPQPIAVAATRIIASAS